jgi:hypothetical protein
MIMDGHSALSQAVNNREEMLKLLLEPGKIKVRDSVECAVSLGVSRSRTVAVELLQNATAAKNFADDASRLITLTISWSR